jgi:DNA-binding NtrC family response regulator
MQDNVSLVIVDDNAGSLELLTAALEQPGLNIFTDPETGLDLIFDKHPQIVLTDLVMPKMTGLELLERVIAFDPAIEVILMTAHYSSESAVEAIRNGASDYLNKPVSIPALREKIGTMVADARRRLRSVEIENELVANSPFEHIIGASPAMWEMYSRIRRIAPEKTWWLKRCIN